MQTLTVQKRLDSLSTLATQGKPINGLSRLLKQRTQWYAAVNRTRTNEGASTAGIDRVILDGLTMERIHG